MCFCFSIFVAFFPWMDTWAGQIKTCYCLSLKAFTWSLFVICSCWRTALWKAAIRKKAQNVSPSKCLLWFSFLPNLSFPAISCLNRVYRRSCGIVIFFFCWTQFEFLWLELWRLDRCACLVALLLMAPALLTRQFCSSRSSVSDSIQHVKCVHGMSKHTGTCRVETGLETSVFWLQPWVEIKRLYSDWMCTY